MLNLIQKVGRHAGANRERVLRLFKEGGWMVVAQLASVLGSLVLVRVLTQYLKPAEYGVLALGLTLGGLFTQVIFGGISNGITRYYSIASEQGDLTGYVKAARRLIGNGIIVTAVITLLVVIVLRQTNWSDRIGMAIAVSFFTVVSTLNAVLSSIQNAARHRLVDAVHRTVDNLLKIALAIAIMRWLGATSTAVLIGYTLSSLAVVTSQCACLRHLVHSQTRVAAEQTQRWSRDIWVYGYPFIIWGVFGWVQQSSSRWALEAFASTDDVGRFAVLSQLGYTPIQTVSGFFMAFLTPILFSRAGDARDPDRRGNVMRLTQRVAQVGLITTAVATIATAVLHTEIMELLVRREYLSVSPYLPLMVLAGGIFAVAQVYAARLFSLMAARQLLPASIGSSLIGTLCAFVFTYYYSIRGAAAALIFHAVSYFVLIIFVRPTIEPQGAGGSS